MFWDKGYTPSANIEALLEKENATVEEFLDDEDILLECKSQKKSIVNYFTRPDVIKRLIELIITEPSEELPMAQRFRHANMACEILTLGLPSLDEKLLADEDTLRTLYSYLENEPPLNPLLSSFFSKTFSMLFTKKAEQDWFLYQQMCLKLLEYIKSQNNFLDLICKHFCTPVIPDLIMQMMREVEGGQIKRNLYEWLTEDKLVERLIAILGNPQETDKFANVAEFLCDLIQQGRSMRLTEQENDSFEPAFNGSNPILKTIESEATIESLLNVILETNAQESAIVSGISVVLTLLKPVVFVDEPNSDRMKFLQNREKEIHEQILTTVIRVVAPRLKDFNELLRNPPNKPEILTTAAKLSPPFGMTRLQICRVFTVLLQTKNEEISKAICETDFFETLLALFKQYCWNNFLHSETEKCLQLIFYTQSANNNNSTQGSTIVNDGSFTNKLSNNSDNTTTFYDFVFRTDNEKSNVNESEAKEENEADNKVEDKEENVSKDEKNSLEPESENKKNNEKGTKEKVELEEEEEEEEDKDKEKEKPNETVDEATGNDDDVQGGENNENENDTTKVQADSGPSALQTHVIVNCKLISKLIDCWEYNKNLESGEKGRRLGYMGHLIKIFKHITNCISESEHIGALIESNLSDASELELWQSIVNQTDGDLTKALATQSKMLANCNAHEAGDFSQHLPKDFLYDNSTWDSMCANVISDLGSFNYSTGNLNNEEDDDDDENNAGGDGHSLFGKTSQSTSALQHPLQVFGVTINPWDDLDPFDDINTNTNTAPWATDFSTDNFADFDAHFSTFASDLCESLVSVSKEQEKKQQQKENEHENEHEHEHKQSGVESSVGDYETVENKTKNTDEGNQGLGQDEDQERQQQILPKLSTKEKAEEYDNNANLEKSSTAKSKSKPNDSANFTETTKESIRKSDTDTDADADADIDAGFEDKSGKVIIRSLHSLMQDSEDDYEDDEGMWTKPLGNSAAEQEENEYNESTSQISISNGPSSKEAVENENNEKLMNISNDIKVPTGQEKEIEHKVISNSSSSCSIEEAIEAIETNDQKSTCKSVAAAETTTGTAKSKTPSTEIPEIPPTTT